MAGKKAKVKVKPLSNREVSNLLKLGGYNFRFNTVTEKIEVNNDELHDALWAKIVGIARVMSFDYGEELAVETIVRQSMTEIAWENKYDPIKEYLEKCHEKWKLEKPSELDKLMSCLEVEEEYKEHKFTFVTKWLYGCIGRSYFEWQNYCLIIKGPQGIGKSTFFRLLAKPLVGYYTEEHPNPMSKDHITKLSTKFIWQIDEFASLLKGYNRNHIKAFLTSETTDVRNPYDRYSKNRIRRASVCGTTNDDDILTDKTGNRRYLILPVKNINLPKLRSINIDLVWGEITDIVLSIGLKCCKFTADETRLQESFNKDSEIHDPIEDYIFQWVVPSKCAEDFVYSTDIIRKVIKLNLVSSQYAPNKVADIMKRLEFKRGRLGDKRGYISATWAPGHHPDATLKADEIEAEDRENPDFRQH